MRLHPFTWTIVPALAGLALVAPLRAMDGESPATIRLAAMRTLAKEVELFDAKLDTKAELVPEPIYRFDDPTRALSDGSIWAFGRVGRPTAILCLSLAKDRPGGLNWVHEFTSLAPGAIKATSQHESGPWTWGTAKPGIELRAIPQAPPPGENDARRLLQLKALARRFKASELLDAAGTGSQDRFELRLLPQPIHRYHDPEGGVIDGAIFLLSYGQNPEIALVIEANRPPRGEPTWSFALGRIAAARLTVSLDDREIAVLPVPADEGPTQAYYAFLRPAPQIKN